MNSPSGDYPPDKYITAGKLRRPGRKSSSRATPYVGTAGQKKEPVGDGVNETVGNLNVKLTC